MTAALLAIAAMAISFAAVRLLVVRLGRSRRRHHVVVAAWTPIVEALRAAGVAAPPLLVFALANYDLVIPSARRVPARLPAATATVADALGLSLAGLQQMLVRRVRDLATAASLLAELRALRPRLLGLPGVAAVGPLYPEDAETMLLAVNAYARICGLDAPAREIAPSHESGTGKGPHEA